MANPKKQSTWDTIQKHMMSGIGYMIPLIMGYTVVKGVFSLVGTGMGINLNAEAALTDSNVLIAFMAWFPPARNSCTLSLLVTWPTLWVAKPLLSPALLVA